jgi:hypothetical protein
VIDEKQQQTWLYGVIPAGVQLKELKRRGDRLPGDVRVEEFRDLAAIVSHAPGEDAKAIRDQALAHARVLEVAVLDAPVVPFRFGTVLPDGKVGDDLLEPWHDQLAQMLESVKDYVQMTLKASYREDVILAEIVDGNPMIGQLREQVRGTDEMTGRESRMRLGELISMTLEEMRQQDAVAIFDQLNPLAVVSRIEALESEYMVLNAPFLVERQHMQEFEDAAGAVADERVDRMTMTLHGPMPAFDFIGEGQLPWG